MTPKLAAFEVNYIPMNLAYNRLISLYLRPCMLFTMLIVKLYYKYIVLQPHPSQREEESCHTTTEVATIYKKHVSPMATFWCESDLMVAARCFPILWRCGLHDYKIGFKTSAVYPLWQINGILVWLCKTKKVLGCGNQFFCFAVDPPFNLISVTCAHIFKIKPLSEEIFSSNSSCACVSKK